MSASAISRSSRVTSLSGKRASGCRPRSSTTSIRFSASSSRWTAATISGGSESRRTSRSSISSRRCSFGATWPPCPSGAGPSNGVRWRWWVVMRRRLSPDGRHEGRLGDSDHHLLHQQGDLGDRSEAGVLQPPIDRRSIGSNRGHHAVIVPVTAGARPSRDHAKRESHQWPHVDAGTGEHLQIVWLVLLCDGDLHESLEL